MGNGVIHLVREGKVLCGQKGDNAQVNEDLDKVTCGNCKRLAKVNSVAAREPTEAELKMVHLSDGEKGVCGVGGEKVIATFRTEDVNCPECIKIHMANAEKKDDPIVRVRIFNQDLKAGQDFNFTYEHVAYHCVSGAIHRVPQSVVKHLKNCKYPTKKYAEGQESGQSNIVTGEYMRFLVTPVSDDE